MPMLPLFTLIRRRCSLPRCPLDVIAADAMLLSPPAPFATMLPAPLMLP